jgi:hypothetical protein
MDSADSALFAPVNIGDAATSPVVSFAVDHWQSGVELGHKWHGLTTFGAVGKAGILNPCGGTTDAVEVLVFIRQLPVLSRPSPRSGYKLDLGALIGFTEKLGGGFILDRQQGAGVPVLIVRKKQAGLFPIQA